MKEQIMSRLAALRAAMREDGLGAVIIPQSDPHHSEYLADHWQMRRYFSGFTGSAGTLVVTADDAALWTDSRYFLQAGKQLEGTGIELMKEGVEGTPTIEAWLKGRGIVGVDGMLLSIDEMRNLEGALDGVDMGFFGRHAEALWGERPELPTCEIRVHGIEYAGEAAGEKIARVMEEVRAQGAEAVVISALDEIAWVLNVRSDDVAYNPVVTAHLLLGAGGNVLFTNPEKVTAEVSVHLQEAGVEVKPYGELLTELGGLPEGLKVLCSTSQVASEVGKVLGDRLVEGKSPIAMLKAVKNKVQIEGIRAAMLRDGVAMVKSLREITEKVKAGEELTEMDIPGILTKYRSAGEGYVEESFETIAGYGEHGAIVHYGAREDTNVAIREGNLLLIDSGANYLDGTTDITRTIALGAPTDEQRRDFTLVMQGHIHLSEAIFPRGTHGHQLDAIARMPLWKQGKLYLHGTGHGVGHFLCVHEGPQSVRLNDTGAPLLPGMLLSNEPGLYLEGRYGIRCENLVVVTEKMVTEFGLFYGFETLTLCPFDRSLFRKDMMTDGEIAWVDRYHETVKGALLPLLEGEDARWLEQACAPL